MNKYFMICIAMLLVTAVSATQTITLSEAMELARENNVTLQSAFYETEATRWSLYHSRTQLLPRVGFNENAVFFDKERVIMPGILALGIPESRQERQNFTSSIIAEQTLFAGGRIYNATLLSRASYEIQKKAFEKILLETDSQVIEYYYSVLKAQASIDVLNRHKALCEEFQSNAEVLYRNGIGLETDVLQWELRTIEIENQLLRLENTLANLLQMWGKVLGLPSIRDGIHSVSASGDIPLPAQIDTADILSQIKAFAALTPEGQNFRFEQYLKEVTEGNPDLYTLQKTEETLTYLKRISYSDFMPTLFATFNYQIESDDKLDLRGNNRWQIMANFSLPLFHSGRNYTQYQQQKYQILAQRNMLSDTTQNIDILARQLWFDYVDAVQSVIQAERSTNLSERSLRITRNLYEQGMTTNTALTDAQNSKLEADISLSNSIYDYILTQNKLNSFKGGAR